MISLKILSVGASHKFIDSIDVSQIGYDGINLDAEYDTVGATAAKLRAGQPADIIIVSEAVARQLAQEKLLNSNSIAPIGKVNVCIGGRADDPKIDLATVESMRSCLIDAPAIFIPDPQTSTAGKHFAGVIEKLQLGPSVNEKILAHPNGATAMHALATSPIGGAIGCTQSTEILSTPGLKISGPIPAPLGLTTLYVAAASLTALMPSAAAALLDFIRNPASDDARRAAGFM
jgi:molybdate transport system substrate-binding protein